MKSCFRRGSAVAGLALTAAFTALPAYAGGDSEVVGTPAPANNFGPAARANLHGTTNVATNLVQGFVLSESYAISSLEFYGTATDIDLYITDLVGVGASDVTNVMWESHDITSPSGRAWREVLAGIDDQHALDAVAFWLECERYAPDEGAPISVLIARCQHTATWLATRLHAVRGADAALYAAAHAQADALIHALTALAERGTQTVPRRLLERLVDEVTGHSPDPSTFAEAAHATACSWRVSPTCSRRPP